MNKLESDKMNLTKEQTDRLDAVTELLVNIAESDGFDRFKYLEQVELNMEANY